MSKIKIVINGKEEEIKENFTIQNIINNKNIKHQMLVVEHNLNIVPKDQYGSILLQEGDKLEIIGFFGGG